MSMDTLIYGLIIVTFNQVLVKSSAMSSPLREDSSASLLLYNPSSHDLDPFEYAVKRETELRPRDSDSIERGRRKAHPGSSYIRIGRSQEQLYNNNNDQTGAEDRSPRGRTDNVIRFGRSSLKAPHHKVEQANGRGFIRLGKSGGSIYTRLGRSNVPPNSPVAVPSDAEMAILCPNILIADDPRTTEDLQLYLAKLMYICNNNNNNGLEANVEDNLHRNNNLEFVEVNQGDSV